MESAGRERGKKIRKQPARGGKRQENARKILNRGNRAKDALKTQHLTISRARNEPKANPVLSAKEDDQSERVGCRCNAAHTDVVRDLRPRLRAKPALECGSSSYRRPNVVDTT
jgi:hypothetical protein